MYETYEIAKIDAGYYEDHNLVEIINDRGLTSNIIISKPNAGFEYNIGDKLVLTVIILS